MNFIQEVRGLTTRWQSFLGAEDTRPSNPFGQRARKRHARIADTKRTFRKSGLMPNTCPFFRVLP